MRTVTLGKYVPVTYLFICAKLTLYISNKKIRVHCCLHACVVCIVELLRDVRSVLSCKDTSERPGTNAKFILRQARPVQWTVHSHWDMYGPSSNTCTDHLVARTQTVVTNTCVIGFSMIVESGHFYLPDIPNHCFMGTNFPTAYQDYTNWCCS